MPTPPTLRPRRSWHWRTWTGDRWVDVKVSARKRISRLEAATLAARHTFALLVEAIRMDWLDAEGEK